jgi:tudor domain-containing protein 2
MKLSRLTSFLSSRYRAEIVAIQVNETMPQELLFDVYFLDYGDSQFIGKKDILELRADFLSLRFQAIECFLAHIQPMHGGNKLDEWDEKAVESFEQMVQAAQWKKLISKVVAYKERKSFAFQRQTKQRESSPIPGVELFDPDNNADKNIALELVKLGHAEMSLEFGDLTKSAILNPELTDEVPAVKVEPEVIVPPQVKEEPVVTKPEAVVTPKVREEPAEPQSNVPVEPSTTNESNNNTIPSTNGSSSTKPSKPAKKPTQDLFIAGKSSKPGKKQNLQDFLHNEQQATSKKTKPAVDWNAMLDSE